MEIQDYISIQQFCKHYELPVSFINTLVEYEFIEIVSFEENEYINKGQIQIIEKIMRLHYDLHINMEGIDVISNLLRQVESLQNELNELSNRLRFYED
ncbi:MAG: chaperone modulator CbpM [Flavobacteriaceae bacterium]|nr:chaperone modulator CbpM [Flavobacteriaceae bacterium]